MKKPSAMARAKARWAGVQGQTSRWRVDCGTRVATAPWGGEKTNPQDMPPTVRRQLALCEGREIRHVKWLDAKGEVLKGAPPRRRKRR